jgi:hypothetical protein
MTTPERFIALLETYGGRTERWPEDERAGALALLERSAEARAQLAAAADLDALLDRVAAPVPAAALTARILATAPRGTAGRTLRPAARRRAGLVAAGSLAAAASLTFWLVRAPAPGAPLDTDAVALLGVLDVPTDALLSDTGLDLGDDAPAFGCDDPTLGCDAEPEPADRSGRFSPAKEMPA